MARIVQLEAVDGERVMTLHQDWIDGKNETTSFKLSSGAGLGSPFLFLVVEHNGVRVREAVDIRAALTKWVDEIVDEIDEAAD